MGFFQRNVRGGVNGRLNPDGIFVEDHGEFDQIFLGVLIVENQVVVARYTGHTVRMGQLIAKVTVGQIGVEREVALVQLSFHEALQVFRREQGRRGPISVAVHPRVVERLGVGADIVKLERERSNLPQGDDGERLGLPSGVEKEGSKFLVDVEFWTHFLGLDGAARTQKKEGEEDFFNHLLKLRKNFLAPWMLCTFAANFFRDHFNLGHVENPYHPQRPESTPRRCTFCAGGGFPSRDLLCRLSRRICRRDAETRIE